MNQRGVTILATYLEKRPLGRMVRVRNVGEDDFIVAIEDLRDGRTQLIHSSRDLRRCSGRSWMASASSQQRGSVDAATSCTSTET